MTKTGIENNKLLINDIDAVSETAYGIIYRTAEQAGFTNAGWTDTEFTGGSVAKVNITHDTGSNPNRVYVDLAGTYKITYMVNAFCNSNVHTTYIRLYKNGSSEVLGSGTVLSENASYAFTLYNTVIVDLAANDYVTLQGKTDNAAATDWMGDASFDTPISAQIMLQKIN